MQTRTGIYFACLCLMSLWGPPQTAAQTVDELEALAVHLYQEGRAAEAIPVAERVMELRKAAARENPIGYANSLNNLAALYQLMGTYEKALPLAEQALAINEKILGPEHPDYAGSLNNLAGLYQSMGAYEKALPLFEQALVITGKVRGTEHPEYADSLNNLAELHRAMGALQKAQPMHEQARAIREKVLGKEHPKYAESLNNLALLYRAMGAYEKAESFYQEALAVVGKALGAEHPHYATSLSNLAFLYESMGAYEKAQPLLERLLATTKKALGAEHPDYANGLNNLAALYYSMGAYEKALPLFEHALAIVEKVEGKEHPEYAKILTHLGILYQSLGDHDKAAHLYELALTINERTVGKEHPLYAGSLNNLAFLYKSLGVNEKAESLYKQALAIIEKVMGREHPNYAQFLNNLGMLYRSLGAYEKAAPLLEQSCAIKEKNPGRDYPSYATSLGCLALTYHEMGAYQKAESFYMQTLAIREKILGREHADYADSLNNLALLYHSMGAHHKAESLARDNIDLRRRLVERVFAAFPEETRRRYFQKMVFHDLPCSLENGPLTAAAAIAFKGAVTASVLEERRLLAAATDPEAEGLIETRDGLRRQYHHALLQGQTERAASLFSQIEGVETQLTRFAGGLGTARRAPQIRTEEVQQRLPAATALIEFLRYGRPLPGVGNQWEHCYGAVVIRSAGDPVFRRLGKAGEIDDAIRRWRAWASHPVGGEADADGSEEWESAGRDLFERLLRPLEDDLRDCERLLVSPDAHLHFVAFAALPDRDGALACQKWEIRYVATGRDLLKEASGTVAGQNRRIVLVGNPDYRDSAPLQLMAEAEDEAAAEAERSRAAAALYAGIRNDLLRGGGEGVRGLDFQPLPGTAIEVQGLGRRFQQAGWETRLLMGAEASEPELRQIRRPAILHLATHGFFLDDDDDDDDAKRPAPWDAMGQGLDGKPAVLKRVRDPMLRAGLALSGAQSTASLWEHGKAPPPDRDGILTAAEAAALDLEGTRLVTLSACETGLGEAQSGETVYGLKRALAVAGAENILITLWRIHDEDTVALMAAFYDRVLAGEAPALALHETQKEALLRLRAERGLQHAVNRAGPFVLTAGTAIEAGQ